jgi:hypothetical protein
MASHVLSLDVCIIRFLLFDVLAVSVDLLGRSGLTLLIIAAILHDLFAIGVFIAGSIPISV